MRTSKARLCAFLLGMTFFAQAAPSAQGAQGLEGAQDARVPKSCDVQHRVTYETSGGWFHMRINGAQLGFGGGGMSGTQSVQDWLVQGQNIVRIDFRGDPGTVSGTFTLEQGCRGAFETRMLETVQFDGNRVAEMTFLIAQPIEREYMKAEKLGDAGLMDAVMRFQERAKAADIDALMALHAPMLADYAGLGAPMDKVVPHMREMLLDKNGILAQKLTARPVLDGRIFEVLNADYVPPFHVDTKVGQGMLSWNTGTY